MSYLNEVKILDQANQNQMAQAWLNDPQETIFKNVERRVVRQLIQAMLYEKIINYTAEKQTDESYIFSTEGLDAKNTIIEYRCAGNIYQSFSLIRLSKDIPVLRVSAQESREATLQDVISEILLHLTDTLNLTSFINELEQTLIKDTQARILCHQGVLSKSQRQFDELESNLLDAHSYHPCYKSRIGFSLADNYAYGAEFKQPIFLLWVAVHQNQVSVNTSSRLNKDHYFEQQLNPKDLQHFKSLLIIKNLDPDDYVFMPVHPWQWENTLTTVFTVKSENKKLLCWEKRMIYIVRSSHYVH